MHAKLLIMVLTEACKGATRNALQFAVEKLDVSVMVEGYMSVHYRVMEYA